MKIGLFDPYLDTLGGGEKYMLTAASCLSKNHAVDVFWDDATILAKAQERFALHLKGVNVKANIFSSNMSLLQRLLITKQYDCIIYLSDGSLPLTLAKKLIVHFQFPVEWVNGENLVTRIKLSRVRSIICNSKFTKGFVDRKFRVASSVIYPPVDVNKLRQYKGKKENLILTVGRFGRLPQGSSFKKQDIMIEIFKKMVAQGLRDWRLVVSISFRDEDRSEVEKLEKLAKDYPITIVKNLPSKDLALFYKKAAIYWHAAGFGEDLEKHPERAEHFGISTVEAMAAGAVPIVFSCGGQLEIVEDGKNGFLWNTKKEWIGKTEQIIKNDKLREKLALNAQYKAKMFNADRFCTQLEQVIL